MLNNFSAMNTDILMLLILNMRGCTVKTFRNQGHFATLYKPQKKIHRFYKLKVEFLKKKRKKGLGSCVFNLS